MEYTFTHCTPGKQYLVRINMPGVRKQYVRVDYVAYIYVNKKERSFPPLHSHRTPVAFLWLAGRGEGEEVWKEVIN